MFKVTPFYTFGRVQVTSTSTKIHFFPFHSCLFGAVPLEQRSVAVCYNLLHVIAVVSVFNFVYLIHMSSTTSTQVFVYEMKAGSKFLLGRQTNVFANYQTQEKSVWADWKA